MKKRKTALKSKALLVVFLVAGTAAMVSLPSCKNDPGTGVAVLESLSVTPIDPSIFEAESLQFTATGNYSDGTTKNLTESSSWESSDTDKATIDSNGLAAAQNPGTTLTTASSGGKEDTTSLTVLTYNPDPGSWSSTSSFSTARYYHAGAVYNGYLYVFGGWDGSNILSSNVVQYAQIDTGGTVGSWQDTTAPSNGRAGHAGFAYNGRLYMVGGLESPGSLVGSVIYSTVNANGTLGSWSNAGGDLANDRLWHTAVAYKGHIYVTGGSTDGSDYFKSVEYAPINANGTVGTWSSAVSLDTGRYWHASVAYRDYLYVIGGFDGSGAGAALGDVVRIPINTDGSLGSSWEEAKTTPSNKLFRYGHTAVVYGAHLYVIGGFYDPDGPTVPVLQDTVSYAPINGGGMIGDWATASQKFSTARGYHSSTLYDGRTYILGGRDSTPSELSDVQYTTFNP